jgi:hypothetical protein
MFRTQDRAVSVQDFKDLALRAPQVSKATCDFTSAPNVLLYTAPYQADYLNNADSTISVSEGIQDAVLEYFSTRTLVGASVGVSPTVPLSPMDITVVVNVQDQYVAQWVKAAVESAIDTFFEFDNVSFEQVLSLGSFYRAIQNVDGVDFSTITRFRRSIDSAQEVYTTRTPVNYGLFRKGTIDVTTSGGITGILV